MGKNPDTLRARKIRNYWIRRQVRLAKTYFCSLTNNELDRDSAILEGVVKITHYNTLIPSVDLTDIVAPVKYTNE